MPSTFKERQLLSVRNIRNHAHQSISRLSPHYPAYRPKEKAILLLIITDHADQYQTEIDNIGWKIGKFNIEVQSADRCNLNNLYLKTSRG